MSSLGDIAAKSKVWPKILDTLMPGGPNWERHVTTGDCRRSCPGWNHCLGNGPGGYVCSAEWRSAEANPLILDVLRHVLQNFAYYDRGDCEVKQKEEEAEHLITEINLQANGASHEDFEEGDERLRLHRYRERNSIAARKKKEDALAAGHLRCEACGIDYLAIFAKPEALRVVECHHTKPLASLKFSGVTKKSELALLCANCHKLAHSRNPPLSINQVTARQQRANKRMHGTVQQRRSAPLLPGR